MTSAADPGESGTFHEADHGVCGGFPHDASYCTPKAVESIHDDRVFVISCRSTFTYTDDVRESKIEVRGDGSPVRKAPIGHFIEDLTQMLWIDAFEFGPWTPSFIESVAVRQSDGTTMTYSRSDSGGLGPEPGKGSDHG